MENVSNFSGFILVSFFFVVGCRRRSRSNTILPKITDTEMEITEDDDDLTVKFQGKIFCSYCAK